VATTREVLQTTIELERQSMALYARFAKVFQEKTELREFWFAMARDEARHVGALELVSTVLGLEAKLDGPSPVPMQDDLIQHLRILLTENLRRPAEELSLSCALGVALEVEETELEDVVGDLLKALQQRDEYERCQRLLVHDLGELSYMIEQHCHDPELLERCDQLVNHHAEILRQTAS
jgi:rubrerythrin